jgi:hypothetical protein
MVAEKGKDEMAMELAQSHANSDPGIQAVYRLIGPEEELENEFLKLLEVNAETMEAGIEPIYFGPHPPSGLLWPLVLVDITPREFELLRHGSLTLPEGWEIGPKLFG